METIKIRIKNKTLNLMENFRKYLEELKKLNLPKDEYAIFGSGPLAARKLRGCEDIDIIVKKELWDLLIKKYPNCYIEGNYDFVPRIKIGNIEIYKEWLKFDVDKLIDNADIIIGLRFVKLKEVLSWKRGFSRDKDKRDVLLIEDYLKHGNSKTKN